jgi:hypothetical protein
MMLSDYPHECPFCASPAYINFMSQVECSNTFCAKYDGKGGLDTDILDFDFDRKDWRDRLEKFSKKLQPPPDVGNPGYQTPNSFSLGFLICPKCGRKNTAFDTCYNCLAPTNQADWECACGDRHLSGQFSCLQCGSKNPNMVCRGCIDNLLGNLPSAPHTCAGNGTP